MTNFDAPHPADSPGPVPRVSVVMPAWNCGRYIRRAIDAVLAQTLDDLELIIVDDASTDDTRAVVESCTDPRIRLLCNDSNHGPAYCRNRGIAAARGEWVALLDADDWFRPERLERLCARAMLHGADAIVDDLFIIDDGRSRPRSTLFTEASCGLEDGAWLSPADLLAHEIGALKPVFRRSLFSVHGHRYDESLRYGEDYLLYLSWLIGGARVLLTRETFYYLRRGATGSLTTSRVAMVRAAIALNQRLLDDPCIQKRPEARKALVRRAAATRDLLVFYEVICPLRARDPAGACLALLRSPRFILITLRRVPTVIGLRLKRLAYRCGRFAARRLSVDTVQPQQEMR
ncbi:glycosyltransferase family 2 protein [Noviherbaspirillum aridicola]|uniref:Succinoglycan biosynthesis protein ExoO n=1 Tax=Noviherbaspirillum aridicola TaxID=2849687 RepID=A0ABQ4Q6K0_9BURK|nr:glycosyltransferase family 2 protein [Noviherbaspirillum aridicola]GIZ52846.1 succinoglycan biosynthesis protein ExoO [Noviherbaspirillum aridicola]